MLIDNRKTALIGDTLKETIGLDSQISIVSGLFSIYAFDALKTELSKIRSARLLLTQFGYPDKSSEPHFKTRLTGDRFEVRLRNQLNQAGVAAECAR